MATTRFDVGLLYHPACYQFTATYPTGGSADTVTLPLGQTDMKLTTAAATIQTALQADADAGFECILSSAGEFVIRHSGAFDLAWPHAELATELGMAAATNQMIVTGSPSPLLYRPTYTWVDEMRIDYITRGYTSEHRQGGSLRTAKHRTWEVSAFVDTSDLPDFRRWAAYMMRGRSATWYRDGLTTSGAWSYTAMGGSVEVVAGRRFSEYSDDWLTAPHQQALSVRFELRGAA